ncbi:MAG: HNH endonuclease [Rhodoglobus sp.]
MRRSLDHIIPLARGGWHAMDNVALAHLRCNITKHAKILDRMPRWCPAGGDLGELAAKSA